MPQAANLVINDGQTTPVATTFAVEQATPTLSSFADRTAGIAAGFRRIKLSNQFATGKQTVNRSKMTIECPVLSTVNGVSTVAYIARANLEFILPDVATDADRKNIFAFVKNALANANVTSTLRDLDPQY